MDVLQEIGCLYCENGDEEIRDEPQDQGTREENDGGPEKPLDLPRLEERDERVERQGNDDGDEKHTDHLPGEIDAHDDERENKKLPERMPAYLEFEKFLGHYSFNNVSYSLTIPPSASFLNGPIKARFSPFPRTTVLATACISRGVTALILFTKASGEAIFPRNISSSALK